MSRRRGDSTTRCAGNSGRVAGAVVPGRSENSGKSDAAAAASAVASAVASAAEAAAAESATTAGDIGDEADDKAEDAADRNRIVEAGDSREGREREKDSVEGSGWEVGARARGGAG